MQSFLSTVVITVVVWSRFHVPFSVADESTWSLRLSNSGRDGRFLNVPIYYGDWVPITRAKQTIQAVASKIEAATKQYRDPPPEIITADQPEDRYVFFSILGFTVFFFFFQSFTFLGWTQLCHMTLVKIITMQLNIVIINTIVKGFNLHLGLRHINNSNNNKLSITNHSGIIGLI